MSSEASITRAYAVDQLAATGGYEVRREEELGADLLLDLDGVTVVEKPVGLGVARETREVQRSLVARPAPDTPLNAFTMMPSSLTTRASRNGPRASALAVG